MSNDPLPRRPRRTAEQVRAEVTRTRMVVLVSPDPVPVVVFVPAGRPA